jgi:error-prone DNA polymerase
MAVGTTPHLIPWPRTHRSPAYAELHAHSDHSLLDGVTSPELLVARAAELGIPALALTDHDALYGAVRFALAAQEVGVKPILGAELSLGDTSSASPYHLTLLVETAAGYRNLCRLITLARQSQEKGIARLDKRYLADHTEGLIALSGCRRGEVPMLLAAKQFDRALEVARGYARLFGCERFFIELQRHHERGDTRLMADLAALADRAGLDVVATSNAHYLHPHQREVHDVLTCIRNHTTLDDANGFLHPNAEYTLRSPREMGDLFRPIPLALENAYHIAERCAPACEVLPAGPQALPRYPVFGGRSAMFYLWTLCEEALQRRYPHDPPRELLSKELAVIKQAGLADYFLIVWDIVRFARRSSIRCLGRGSAANSLVAYLLGISPIDPVACDLVFERFLSKERGVPPDIDIDFAADRREEVIQYVYERYGEAHAAMACTFVTYRSRSAVQDTARALGFPPGVVERLSEDLDVRDAEDAARAREAVTSLGMDGVEKSFQHLLRIAPKLHGIPRHLGIHNGGMIISGPPLCELVPLEPATMPGRVVTQWDKEGLEGAGMVKIDLLGLRMLSAVEDAVTIAAAQTGRRPALERLPPNDPKVYDMLCKGQTVGVFQVESRAQASLIPRFQPRSFEDLVLQISLIRPGPIQANMVHPYLRRRKGLEPVTYLHPLLEDALAETLGVIVFQEQVLKVARDLAGFTPGRAELLRRALSHKRADERILGFREAFIQGALSQGVDQETAEHVFDQLRAFGGYAFPKSHAAAFAVLTYQSAWLRQYHPEAFFAGLLRHQPMGFYPAHVIVSEARRCGVDIHPVDVEASDLLATVEGRTIRLGLAVVTGLGEAGGRSIVKARQFGPFCSLADFCRRTKLGRRAIEALIWAGAFDGWDVPRRQLVWDLKAALDAAEGPPALSLPPGDEPRFDRLSPRGRLWAEVAHTGMSAGPHIIEVVGGKLRSIGVTPSGKLTELRNGDRVWVGGIIVARQRPPTAKGTAFLALEDEGGLVNVVLKPEVYEAHRKVLQSPFVAVEGKLQRRGQAINVLARKIVAVELRMDATAA